MTVRRGHWRGALPRAVLLAVTVGLVPAPAVASDAQPVQKAKSIQASMREVVAREAAATPARYVSTPRAAQTGTAKESTGFFKTGPGIIALVVMVAGTGYAIYSAQHDRITSPAKK